MKNKLFDFSSNPPHHVLGFHCPGCGNDHAFKGQTVPLPDWDE